LTSNPLSKFVSAERDRYEVHDGNRFAVALAQAARYYDFLLIIIARYEVINDKFVVKQKALMAEISGADGTMSAEQMALLDELGQLTTRVHLEIESFYVFAKILLDKIARFIETYFGQAHGCSLASHDKLTKSNERFRAAKGLVYPPGFTDSLVFLKEQIADYRDKQVEHLRNPRIVKATSFDDTGQTRLVTTHTYPTEHDEQVESEKLPELLKAINTYIQQVAELVTMNRDRTRFRIRKV